MSTSTFDWDTHELRDFRDVLAECDEALNETGLCVIMLHPQDYANGKGELDSEKYFEYLALLEGIGKLDANVVNFRDLYYDEFVYLG